MLTTYCRLKRDLTWSVHVESGSHTWETFWDAYHNWIEAALVRGEDAPEDAEPHGQEPEVQGYPEGLIPGIGVDAGFHTKAGNALDQKPKRGKRVRREESQQSERFVCRD